MRHYPASRATASVGRGAGNKVDRTLSSDRLDVPGSLGRMDRCHEWILLGIIECHPAGLVQMPVERDLVPQ